MRGVAIVCAVCTHGCASETQRAEYETITVTVLASGMPMANVPVWFQARDGALLSETRTDAVGVAGSFADVDATVTVETMFTSDGLPVPALFTIAGAQPGDRLVIEGTSEESAVRNVHFELPVDPVATEYVVLASCSQESFAEPSLTMVLAGCDDDEPFMIYSEQNGVRLGELYVAPTRVTDGMTIDLRARTFAPVSRVAVDFAGFSGQHVAYTGSSLVFEHSIIELPHRQLDLQTGQAAWSAFGNPQATIAIDAIVDEDFTLDPSSHLLVEWGPGLDRVHFDGSMLLPKLAKPSLDADTRTLTWTQPTGGELACVEITTSMTGNSFWRVLAPTDGLTITYPKLPAAVGEYMPVKSDPAVTADIELISSTLGYDGLRAHYFESRTHPLVAGPQGRTVVRTFMK